MVRDAGAGALGNRGDLEDVLTWLDIWEEGATTPDPMPRLNPDATVGDELVSTKSKGATDRHTIASTRGGAGVSRTTAQQSRPRSLALYSALSARRSASSTF